MIARAGGKQKILLCREVVPDSHFVLAWGSEEMKKSSSLS